MNHQQAIFWISSLPWIVGIVVVLLAWYCDWSTRWFIDPVRGNDRNHGHSDLKPLRSYSECMRRIGHVVVFNHRVRLLYYTEQRAREKQQSRDQDDRDVREGRVTRKELRKRNTFLNPKGGKIDFSKSKPGSLW